MHVCGSPRASCGGHHRNRLAHTCVRLALQGDVWHADWISLVELGVDGAFLFDIFLNFR